MSKEVEDLREEKDPFLKEVLKGITAIIIVGGFIFAIVAALLLAHESDKRRIEMQKEMEENPFSELHEWSHCDLYVDASGTYSDVRYRKDAKEVYVILWMENEREYEWFRFNVYTHQYTCIGD